MIWGLGARCIGLANHYVVLGNIRLQGTGTGIFG